jgi:hypothetical protein
LHHARTVLNQIAGFQRILKKAAAREKGRVLGGTERVSTSTQARRSEQFTVQETWKNEP